jgi:hypothetical protein
MLFGSDSPFPYNFLRKRIMPKKIAIEINGRIIKEIGRIPGGIGMDELHSLVEDVISRRSLQRRVSQFVNEGKLVREGKQRGVRYRVAPITGEGHVTGSVPHLQASAEVYVPISTEGEEIREYVRQLRQQRTPVGYNQSFLESYFPNQTWYLPVELRGQLRQIGTPPDDKRPAGTFARDILASLLIDLSWASSHLEGNTYSHLDTQRLIEFGQAAEGKDALETQMILNHKAAIELLVHEADLVDLTPHTLFNLHALLSDGLLADGSACGRIRLRPVEIGGSVYRPIALPQRLEELYRIILSMAQEINDPFEQAFFVMVHLPAYSGEVGHAFQSKPAGHSGGSRPPIPVIPATLVGA